MCIRDSQRTAAATTNNREAQTRRAFTLPDDGSDGSEGSFKRLRQSSGFAPSVQVVSAIEIRRITSCGDEFWLAYDVSCDQFYDDLFLFVLFPRLILSSFQF